MRTPLGSRLAECEDVAWFRDRAEAARGSAAALARRLGFTEQRSAEVVLAMSELVTNMRKHAVDASLVLRVLRTPAVAGIEILVTDHGPGIADIQGALRDGASSVGTLGIGLGAVGRLADTFDIHSRPGVGTVQLARFWPRPRVEGGPAGEPLVAGLTRPIGGEQVCGDAWAARVDLADGGPGVAAGPEAPRSARGGSRQPLDWQALTGTRRPPSGRDRTADHLTPAPRSRTLPGRSALCGPGEGVLVMLCDGLGHGPAAARAGQAAVHAFRASAARTPEQAMEELHRALRGTRGAVVAVARIEAEGRRVLFCGVGNITASLVTGTTRSNLLSHPGIVGTQIRQLHTYEYPLPEQGALVMHSDGLSERWTPADLGGLLHHSPAMAAAGLLRHAGTRRDDASVVMAKGAW